MRSRKIYLASSWRNEQQPAMVEALRAAGHEVYDFRHPAPGDDGFAWGEIDADWRSWTPEQYVKHVTTSPEAARGYKFDKDALDWCDTCVLLLACGRSAHLEAGYAIGQGKTTIFYLVEDRFEAELMYLLGDGFALSIGELLELLAQ